MLVKPRLLGIYEPMKPAPGSHQRWMKSEAKPVVIVRPRILDYVPDGELTMEGFPQKDVISVALVESTSVGCQAMSFAAKSTRIEPSIGEQSKPTHSVIESKVDGEFEGCDGDSIVKVMNKQIWRQMDYQIQYRYSYMPDVLVYYSAGGWEMWVEGIDKRVRVERLR